MHLPHLSPELLANLSVKWVLIVVGLLLLSLWMLRLQPLNYGEVLTRRRYRGTWPYYVAWIVENLQVVLSVVVVVFLVIRPFFFQAFYIPSESMENTLIKNDRLLVNKLVYRLFSPHRRDIAVFKAPPEATPEEQDYIKRVIGLPGETVEVISDRILVDDKVLLPFNSDGTNEGPIVSGYGDEAYDSRSPEPGVLEVDVGSDSPIVVVVAPEISVTRDGDEVIVNGKRYPLPEGYGSETIERFDGMSEFGGDRDLRATAFTVDDELRLIAVQGKSARLDDAHVLINGKRLEEPYIKAPPHYHYGPRKLAENEYFMMGDNRNNSRDSHEWGPLERWRFIGRAEVRFWPPLRVHLFNYSWDSLPVWALLIIAYFWFRGQPTAAEREER